MKFLYVIEFLVIVVVIVIGITQIVAPLMENRGMWPIFRRQGRLEGKLTEVRQRRAEQKIQREIKSTLKGKRDGKR